MTYTGEQAGARSGGPAARAAEQERATQEGPTALTPAASEDEAISYPRQRARELGAPVWDWLSAKVSLLAQPEHLVTFVVVGVCVGFVFWQFDPSQLFTNTTTSGGDTGAHVLLPWALEHQVLPHFRLEGWTSSNWDGFPVPTFYFPMPVYSIVALSWVIPYNIAFKLLTAAPMVLLPLAGWLMGRLGRAPFPVPAVLAAATVPYMFGTEYSIYGGNIPSTLAGEFAFAWSLWFALVFLGLVMSGLQTGRHRAWAAVMFAATFASHIDPTMFAAMGAVVLVVAYALRNDDWMGALRWSVPTLVVGGLLVAWWAWPFFVRQMVDGLVTNMGYTRNTAYLSTLFPSGDTWLVIMAGMGAMLSISRRRRIGGLFTAIAVLSAVAFRFMPQSILWNNRVLPFWFLSLYVLAAMAVGELYAIFAERSTSFTVTLRAALLPGPLLVLVLALAWAGFPLRVLPGEHPLASSPATYEWLGMSQKSQSYIPGWITWNYSGYQAGCPASPLSLGAPHNASFGSGCAKSRWPEYEQIVAELKSLSQKYGCGNLMWEYQSEMNGYGTPDALTILPYWTNGCIGSMEGLYYEASATTPFHFINQSELSLSPSNPMVGLTYAPSPNIPLGVQHLQMLGVKYYMALNTELQQQAAKDPSLKLIAKLGPYSVSYSGSSSGPQGTQQQYWDIYLVLGSPRVHALANQPVVMEGLKHASQPRWLQVMQPWYLDPSAWDVYIAATGPSTWTRVPYGTTHMPVTPEPPTSVSDIVEHNSSISFNVSRTGVPVVVTVSYFPNWQVHGAQGIYRVSPNLMAVVPTSHHVTLYYGTTPIDYEGWILTLLAIGGLVWLVRKPRARVAAVSWAGPGRQPGLNGPPFGGNGSGGAGWASVSAEGAGLPGALLGSNAVSRLDQTFKAYDIRGVVPDQLDADLARKVGAAFATFAKAPRILVGHDMRPSGQELVEAFTDGVTSMGTDVVLLGLISTDEMFYASGALDAPGAMFTASHNPARYNGIKLCLAGARPVGAGSGLADIRASVERDAFEPVAAEQRGKVSRQDVLSSYVAKVQSFVDPAVLRPLKVVADTANGMGGLVVPAVFEGMPFDLEMLYPELDGNFPNHPADPIQPANLRDLQARVLETGADVGLAFDGDADRCFLVDDKAVPVSGSTTTAIVAKAMLEKYPGSRVLYNLICSKAVPEIIRENGGEPIVTRVGHSFVKQIMAETGAIFGGEHSGHYYFRDNYRADSGSIAALVMLEVISKAGVPLSQLRKPFERYAMSGEINTEVKDPRQTVEDIAERFAKQHPEAEQSHMDGVTIDFGDWWFNVRPSNTEPLVRLNVEAPNEQACKQRTEEILGLIREQA